MRAFVILYEGLGVGADTLQVYVGKNEIKKKQKEQKINSCISDRCCINKFLNAFCKSR